MCLSRFAPMEVRGKTRMVCYVFHEQLVSGDDDDNQKTALKIELIFRIIANHYHPYTMNMDGKYSEPKSTSLLMIVSTLGRILKL